MLVWFLPLLLFFLMMGLPVFFGMLAAPGILLWLNDQSRDLTLLYRNVYNGMDSFPLMAIPFFMLAGELMNRGGITMRLVDFSQATFASPKRKAIQAYSDFVEGRGDLYVPTPEEKAAFKEAATPVFEWFKTNVKNGPEVFDAINAAVTQAEEKIDGGAMKDMQ